jgi:Tol biopolymer transport system component
MPAGVTASSPRFSPDGQRLSFNHVTGGNALAVIGRDGKNLQVLSEQCDRFCESAWHPTSGEIFFSRNATVHAVAASGGTPRVVTKPYQAPKGIDVSQDGQYLGFQSYDVVILKLADNTQQTVSTRSEVYGLRFSPDGKKLLYRDYNTDAIRIIQSLENGTTTTVLDTSNYLSAADWFPDGNQLAVVSDTGLELVTLQASGEPTRKMLKEGTSFKDVDVSPDGKAIAYAVNGQRSLFVLTGF